MSTRSYCLEARADKASRPFAAVSACRPSFLSMAQATFWLVGLSSARRILPLQRMGSFSQFILAVFSLFISLVQPFIRQLNNCRFFTGRSEEHTSELQSW